MVLKLHASVGKGSKIKVRKFSGLIPTFVEVKREKLVGRGRGGEGWLFAPHPLPSSIGLILELAK